MRKFVVTLMASLFSCSAASAFWPEATDSSLEIGVGYRQDRLEWKTRNRCHSSDRCSESSGISYHSCFSSDETLNNGDDVQGRPLSGRSKVKWRNLNIWEIEGRGKYVTCDNIYLRANGDYGWITSGKNHDSDHREFGRRGERDGADEGFDYNSGSDFEFARSHSRARGHVYDARLAVGYEFRLCDCSLALVPLVGYSWHGQHIRDRHLKQRCFDENFDQDQDFVFADGRSGGGSSDESGSSCTNNYESFFGSSSGLEGITVVIIPVGMVLSSVLILTIVSGAIGHCLERMSSTGQSIMQEDIGFSAMTCPMGSVIVRKTLMEISSISGLGWISATAGQLLLKENFNGGMPITGVIVHAASMKKTVILKHIASFPLLFDASDGILLL